MKYVILSAASLGGAFFVQESPADLAQMFRDMDDVVDASRGLGENMARAATENVPVSPSMVWLMAIATVLGVTRPGWSKLFENWHNEQEHRRAKEAESLRHEHDLERIDRERGG